MIKKIFSYGAVEALTKGLNKLLFLLLPLLLTTQDYGKIGLIMAIEIVAPLVTFLGFDRAILRFYEDRGQFLKFTDTLFNSVIGVHIALFVIFLIAYFSGWENFLGLEVFPTWVVLIGLIFFQGMMLFKLNILRVEEEHNLYFIIKLAFQLSKLVLVLGFVWLWNDFNGYLYGSLISIIILTIVLSFKKKFFFLNRPSKKTFTVLFVFTWPFIFHGIAGNVLGHIDKFIIERYMTLNDVGLYTFAYSIGSAVVFAFAGVSTYLEPLIYKTKDEIERNNLLNTFFSYAMIFGSIFILILMIFGKYLLSNLYNNDYAETIVIIRQIAISHLLLPFYLRANYRFIYHKRSLNIAMFSIIASIFNIIINVLLIEKYGLSAAVYSTYISYLILSILFVLFSLKFRFTMEVVQLIVAGILFATLIFYEFETLLSILIFVSTLSTLWLLNKAVQSIKKMY